jgi:16S rRNA (cytosine967-C5)-methyltransferase
VGRSPAPEDLGAKQPDRDAHTQSEPGARVKARIAPVPPQSGDEPTHASVTPARAVAYNVLRRVFEQDAWADRALHGEARRLRLDTRERALATQLAFGSVQRAATLDHVIAALAGRPAARLDPPVLAALRLGVYQLVYLDRVPAHAAVGESVELAKADAPRRAGLVNAVLRL